MRDMKLRDMKMRHQNARVENARHENARNTKVWNTACCICLSIAEQECMSRQERAPDFAANCVLVNAGYVRSVSHRAMHDLRLCRVGISDSVRRASPSWNNRRAGAPSAGLRLPWFCVCTSLTVMT